MNALHFVWYFYVRQHRIIPKVGKFQGKHAICASLNSEENNGPPIKLRFDNIACEVHRAYITQVDNVHFHRGTILLLKEGETGKQYNNSGNDYDCITCLPIPSSTNFSCRTASFENGVEREE